MEVRPSLVILQSWKVNSDKHQEIIRERAERFIDDAMKSQHAPKRRQAFRIFFDGNMLAVVGKRSVMVKAGMV